MTEIRIKVDVKDILDNIDSYDLVNSITQDAFKDNSDWWVRNVCKPFIEEVKNAFKNEKVVKEVLTEIIDRQFDHFIADTIKEIVDERTTDVQEEVIKRILKNAGGN